MDAAGGLRRLSYEQDVPGDAPRAGSVKVLLEPVVPAHAHVLDQLFQLYAHDFSELVSLPLREDGRIAVTVSELWRTGPNHHAFFVRVDERLAGFALARRGSRLCEDREVMDVAEFFIVRGERRRGVGLHAARELLARFPGRWEVRVREANVPALRFWSSVLATTDLAAVSTYLAEGVAWRVLRADVTAIVEPTPGEERERT